MPEILWIPTAVAFAANFFIGAVWYGVLANPWMEECGFTQEMIKNEKWPTPTYLLAAIGAAIQSVVFAAIVAYAKPANLGITMLIGLGVGLLAAFATIKHHSFERRTWRLLFIDGGNDLAGFLAMALVFGLWP